MSLTIKTACWFDKLPEDHQRVGISRASPRNVGPGYKMYRKLAPGPWFRSVDADEYFRLYHAEILAPLDPQAVATELAVLCGDRIPVLLCFEKVGSWCHRGIVGEWLSAGLGVPVREFRHDDAPADRHPLMPTLLHRHD